MKQRFDQTVLSPTVFAEGDKVLALWPVMSSPFQTKSAGLYTVAIKVSDLNYLLTTPDRRKTSQLCHANLLKPCHEHPKVPAGGAVSAVGLSEGVLSPASPVNPSVAAQEHNDIRDPDDGVLRAPFNNSETLKQLPHLLQHLSGDKRGQLMSLIQDNVVF
jgi:hypothetical protein